MTDGIGNIPLVMGIENIESTKLYRGHIYDPATPHTNRDASMRELSSLGSRGSIAGGRAQPNRSPPQRKLRT